MNNKYIPVKSIPRYAYAAALAVAGGVLWGVSFPKISFAYGAFIFLVPVYWIMFRLRIRQYLWYVFLAGITANAAQYFWIKDTVVRGGGGTALGIICVLLLCGYLALYPVGFCALVSMVNPEENPHLFVWYSACVWTLTECLRGVLMWGFPWMLLGYALNRWLVLIQIAEYTGVYGISFFIVFANATFFLIIYRSIAAKTKLCAACVLLAMTLSVLLFGARRMASSFEGSRQSASVALLQGNIDHYKKWDIDYYHEILAVYRALTEEVSQEKTDLIIWPETALPGYLETSPFLREWTEETVRGSGVYNIIGALILRGKYLYNGAYLFDYNGHIKDDYYKRKLVPFAEMVPFKEILSGVVPVLENLGGMTAGRKPGVFNVNGIRYGIFICFESIFPHLVRDAISLDAEVLVDITNDAWFLFSSAPYQHFIMCIYRAVEFRRPLLRAANTGITACIDPAGRIVSSTAIFGEQKLICRVFPATGLTFYARFGQYLWILPVIICIIIIYNIRKRKGH